MFLLATALLNLGAMSAEAAIARVGVATVFDNTTATTGSVTIPATTAGDLLVVVISGGGDGINGGGSSAVSLGATAMVSAVRSPEAGSANETTIWYLANIPGGQTTVTWSYAAGSLGTTDNGIIVQEYSGAATTAPVDVTATWNSNNSAVTVGNSGTATATAANELWIGGHSILTSGTWSAPTPTGTTLVGSSTAGATGIAFEDNMTLGAAANALGATCSGNDSWAGALVVFKAAAGTCTTNAPTFGAWSPTSGNVTPGGSTSYTVTVTNADSVGCANANITFTSADTPATPNTNFNGSTVSSNCTNIAPGGTCTATLTTSSPAGATPPSSETTKITGTESVGSKAGTTGTSATTNLVAACTTNAPTFGAWSPTSGNVTPGGGTSYTVTVTNADSVGCANANITFTSADTPATPNTNFNGSTVSSNCTNIAPGGTCTATLTTSSPAGATPPSSETTKITGTESVGSKAGTTGTSAATNLVVAGPSVPAGSIPVVVTVAALMAAYGAWMGIRQRRGGNTQQGTE
ncbi:MAG: hypothetical protein M0024_14175 [Nitrospiraceae bacterium]|nr:hypothetical protein [Nitrospiraceae bacterium]